jgi:predicted nucleic acid-binding protein
VSGLLRVPVAAKQDKLIADLKPVLDNLMTQAKF